MDRSLFFDPVSKHFKLVFTASTSAKGRTHIYASSRWHYPQGVAATVEPEEMVRMCVGVWVCGKKAFYLNDVPP